MSARGNLAEAVRRVTDAAAAFVLLALSAPALAIISLAVRLTMGRGVLFCQPRLGRGGHPFTLVKFRTMRRPTASEAGPEHDAGRLTRVGRFLRASSLDELPSLWNVVRGDLALVGPRPLPVHYWSRFRGSEYERFLVRPGITGLAQVSGRNSIDWDDRLALDVRYVRERSLRGDLHIVVRTVATVTQRTGIDRDDGVTMTELPADRT